MTDPFPQLLTAGVAVAAAAATVAAHAIVSPRSSLFCPTISRGSAAGAGGGVSGGVALTFDDGPWPGGTEPVLETLAAAGAPAAFFVIGRNARRWPDLVRRIHAGGHLIANHSYDHDWSGPFGWRGYWHDQLTRTDDAVEAAIGRRTALFRPPMGIKTWHLAAAVRRTGHRVVTWTRRGLDGVPTSVDAILRRLAHAAAPGDILALHDGREPGRARDPAATIAALPPLLTALQARGLSPVRLDALIDLPGYAGTAAA